MTEVLAAVVDEARAGGLAHPILRRMVEVFGERAKRCVRTLEAAPE